MQAMLYYLQGEGKILTLMIKNYMIFKTLLQKSEHNDILQDNRLKLII